MRIDAKTIAPIQTAYKGYHFRSRLEARWAVFFDALGLRWEYEPEGFVLPDGTRYLPDFRVTGTDSNPDPFTYWFEVKGAAMSEAEKRKVEQFAVAVNAPVIVLQGTPGDQTRYKSGEGLVEWALWSYRRRPWAYYGCEDDEGDGYPLGHYYQRPNQWPGSPAVDLAMAIQAARSARFEHGQQGATL